jgi:hypothetical protein
LRAPSAAGKIHTQIYGIGGPLNEIRARNDEQERQMAQFIKEQMACS